MPRRPASGLLCCGPAFFVSAAFILSIIANSRCKFVMLDENNPFRVDGFIVGINAIGLWCFEGNNGLWYDSQDVNVDSKYDAARGLGTTTMVFGFLIWLFYLFAGCRRFPPQAFMLVGFGSILTCLFQSLVFLILKSGACAGGCSLDTHGKCAIAAAVLWFVAGFASCPAGKKADDGADGGGGGGGQEAEP